MKNLLWLGQRKWKAFSVVLFLQFVSVFSWAQVSITGKVTGPDGSNLPAISVTVKNTGIGTATDVNGMYSINTNLRPGTYTLVFSGVGFRSKEESLQVDNSASNTVNVTLTDDALNLDEVIVTGVSAGTTRKQLGSYVSTVKADQLTKGATGNVLAASQFPR